MRPVNNIAGGSIGRSRLVDKLLRDGNRANNGTTAGGLAHVLGSGMRGLMASREMARQQTEQQQEADALNAMNRGMSARQWQPPQGEALYSGPGADAPEISREQFMKEQAPAGGYDGALTALDGLGASNPAGGRLTQQLLFKKAERDQARGDLMEQRAYDESQQPRFETVQNPLGMGGAAQRNTRTGEITGYQAAPKPSGPGRGMWAHDRENGSVTMVDEATIRANPERYGPQSEAADPKYMSRKRIIGNQEVFEVSYDGGRSWSVEGEPYDRSMDPTAALMATLLGGGGGAPLLDGQGGGQPGGQTMPVATPSPGAVGYDSVPAPAGPAAGPASGPAAGGPSPADIEATLQAAREAVRSGRDPASVAEQLRAAGIDPGRL